MVHITKGKFENTPILIPPHAEQKRIVVAIEKVFSQLDNITAEL
jgi:restriction endonuclease S subunit